MKKSILILSAALFLFAGTSLFTSCNSADTKAKTESSDKVKGDELADAKEYQCPMKCEGEKTYDKPGNCPECGMEIKEIKSHKGHSH